MNKKILSEEKMEGRKSQSYEIIKPRLWEEKASIMGMKLSLDLGKNFDADIFEILGFRACRGEIYDEKPRLWEGIPI